MAFSNTFHKQFGRVDTNKCLIHVYVFSRGMFDYETPAKHLLVEKKKTYLVFSLLFIERILSSLSRFEIFSLVQSLCEPKLCANFFTCALHVINPDIIFTIPIPITINKQ